MLPSAIWIAILCSLGTRSVFGAAAVGEATALYSHAISRREHLEQLGLSSLHYIYVSASTLCSWQHELLDYLYPPLLACQAASSRFPMRSASGNLGLLWCRFTTGVFYTRCKVDFECGLHVYRSCSVKARECLLASLLGGCDERHDARLATWMFHVSRSGGARTLSKPTSASSASHLFLVPLIHALFFLMIEAHIGIGLP